MKRFLALLLALLMLLSLAACGSSGSSSSGRSSGSSGKRSSSGKYTDPIKIYEKHMNAKSIDYIELVTDVYNGCDGGYTAKILKVLSKSADFRDFLDEFKWDSEDDYEDRIDEYGKNFKISFKNDKDLEEKLDKSELKEYRDQLRSMGEDILDMVEEYRALDSYEELQLADEYGLASGDLRQMIDYMESLGKKLKSAEVDAGYELEIVMTITGSELDEPEEDDADIIVLKVNGKWINYTLLRNYSLRNIMDRVF